MISRSVPQTPSAIVSTSSAPSEAGGSGTSHSSTESGFGGRTVMARKGDPWELSRPRDDSARRKKFRRGSSFRPSEARAGIHNRDPRDVAPVAAMDSGLAAARRPG